MATCACGHTADWLPVVDGKTTCTPCAQRGAGDPQSVGREIFRQAHEDTLLERSVAEAFGLPWNADRLFD